MSASWQKEHWDGLVGLLQTNLDDENWDLTLITFENGQPYAHYTNTQNPACQISHTIGQVTYQDQNGELHDTDTLIEAQLLIISQTAAGAAIDKIMATPVNWSDAIFKTNKTPSVWKHPQKA